MEKKDIINKEPKYKVGEVVVCKLNGQTAYIINSFRACIVKFLTAVNVIPEKYLVQSDLKRYHALKRTPFKRGDKVEVIDCPAYRQNTGCIGEIFATQWFYVIHLHKSGELKVVLAGILAKKGTKVISGTILTVAPGQNFGSEINYG